MNKESFFIFKACFTTIDLPAGKYCKDTKRIEIGFKQLSVQESINIEVELTSLIKTMKEARDYYQKLLYIYYGSITTNNKRFFKKEEIKRLNLETFQKLYNSVIYANNIEDKKNYFE